MRTMEFAIRLMKIKQPQQNSGQVIHSLDSELGIFLCCGKVMFGKRVCVASCLALNIKYDKAPNIRQGRRNGFVIGGGGQKNFARRSRPKFF